MKRVVVTLVRVLAALPPDLVMAGALLALVVWSATWA